MRAPACSSNHGNEYRQRLAARRASVSLLEQKQIRIGNLRLLVILVALVIAWQREWIWLAPPALAFIALMRWHERVLRSKTRAERAVLHYEFALARVEDRWPDWHARGVRIENGDRFRDPAHVFAEDLDLFGSGSLFHLLNQARTPRGEEILARWLLRPSPLPDILARQQAVRDITPRLDLREDLFVLGEDVRQGVHPDTLIAWAEGPPVLRSQLMWTLAALLTTLVFAAGVWWNQTGHWKPFLAVAAASISLGFWLRRRANLVLAAVENASQDLALLAGVLARLEAEQFTAPRLQELRRQLDSEHLPPSRHISRLSRLMELVDSRDNQAVRLADPVILYSLHLAFAVERWRAHTGTCVRGWIEAVGELEALGSLAGYAYEHPNDPSPSLQESPPESPALFDGEGLGHPLLPEARTVRNDVHFKDGLRLWVVSGSNMSGKSTLLRVIGINAVLAMAGAPVRASRLTLTPLAIGASIRVNDSLQGGTSRFYAEIQRLRRIVDLASGPLPLLFLLDELLNGTNSHDRRVGAEGVVRELVTRNAIGLITTHDLALAAIADHLAPKAANVHFEDHIEAGRITFDYRLRPGVVQKSNALELMRSIGLLKSSDSLL